VNFHAPVTVEKPGDRRRQRDPEDRVRREQDRGRPKGNLRSAAAEQNLTPRLVRQGIADIEALAVEAEKPEEKRNWRAVLERGQAILELVGKGG
jgi:hypothetical protein